MRFPFVPAMLLLAIVAVVLPGCACNAMGTSACDGCEASNLQAGCLPKALGNSCGWDFYVPADMIEGRQQRDCACAPNYYPGQVVARSYAVPATPAAAPAAPAPAAAPAAP